MGFIRRQCWHCNAGETEHTIVSVTRKSANEYYAFSICSSCHLPSCAVLQSGAISQTADETHFETLGDLRSTEWNVVGFWPSEMKNPLPVGTPTNLAEPAERAYKRAMDMAKDKHTRSLAEEATCASALSPDEEGARCGTRVTLREFSERLVRQARL